MFETKITTWKQYGKWHQKTFIGSDGKPNFTYHYGSKISPSCSVIELRTKKSKNLLGYKLIEKDLRDILLFIDEYKKLAQSAPFEKIKFLLKAIVRGIVITYGKCFASAEGRKIKLEDKCISDKNKKQHDEIMVMRNSYVAHAGQSIHEQAILVYPLPPKTKYNRGQFVHFAPFLELRQTISFPEIGKEFKELTEEIHKYVTNKIKEIEVEMDINKIELNDLFKLTKKNKKRITLNDKEFLKLKKSD